MDDADLLLADLERVSRLQSEAFAMLVGLSRYPAADQIPRQEFEAFFVATRLYVDGAIDLEARRPGTVDVPGAANPLVQQLSIWADVVQARGDRAEASLLRAEADGLASAHLTGTALAGHRRTRAVQAAAEGRFHEALIGLDAAHEAFLTAGDQVEAARTLVELANVLEWLGDYQRARDVLTRAGDLVAAHLTSGPPSADAVAAALAEQFAGIMDGEGSSGLGEQALAVRHLYYQTLFARGRLHRWLGEWDAAAALIEQFRAFTDIDVVPAVVDFWQATVALGIGDLDRAEALLATAAPAFDTGLARARLGGLCQVRSDLALRRGEAGEALRQADAGLADQTAYPDLDLSWKLHWRRGRALAALHRRADALEAYRASAHAADTLRMAPLGYALDSTAVSDKLPMLHEAIDLAVAAGEGERAVWFIELIKSRALSALVSFPAQPISGDASTGDTLITDPDGERFDELSARIDTIAFALYSGTATSPTALLAERQTLLRARRNLLERIRLRDPRWRSVSEPLPLDIPALRARLAAAQRVALVFHLRGPRLVSALLTPDGVVLGDRTLPDPVLAGLTGYAENLRRRPPDPFLADLSGESQIGLDDLLTPDVAAALAAAATSSVVLVVPHGILHLLPWATMTLAGTRLVEHTAVGVLPNLAVLVDLDQTSDQSAVAVPAAAPSAALFGDPDTSGLATYPPLPQAGPELDDLEKLYGPTGLLTDTTRGAAATQAALVSLLARPDADGAVLHVACHADFDAADPISSGLILTGSTLDAAELVRTRCTFRDVVLSACSTGWRPQTAHGLDLAGDDALGLVAAFLEAGARSLVVSITPAQDDIARTFSLSWHRHRRAGATPLHATRAAQLELLAADPGAVWAWAGFTAYASR